VKSLTRWRLSLNWERPGQRNLRQDRAHCVANNPVSAPELRDTGRNIVEVPCNPMHELSDTRHNVVEVPKNSVHEFYTY